MKFNSVKFKIALLSAAILGAILILYSSILYVSLHYTLYSDIDEELRTKAAEINKTIDSYLERIGSDEEAFIFAVKRTIRFDGQHPNQKNIRELERRWSLAADRLGLKGDYVNFLDIHRESIASSTVLRREKLIPLFLKNINVPNLKKEGFRNIKFKKRNLRIINVPFSYKEYKGFIQVGTSLNPAITILQNRLHAIIISIPIILLLTSFVGWFLAAKILKPVEEITKTARRITHQDLSARVNVERLDEEMKYLAEAFNEMIARLDKSFKYIAEFSSHVAHELKTPLAIMRGESEVVLRKERDPEQYQRAIKVNLEEIERMIKTIEDLLLLAKLNYHPEVFKFEPLDLIVFFKEIHDQSKILASGKNIAVNMDIPQGPINIQADKLHLRRLFFNLVHNAIKFNSSGGKIDMAVKLAGKEAKIFISDTGLGIAEENLPKIFDRFFHIDRKDENIEPGTGLGLSIAQSIAKIHGGEIEVASRLNEGSTFTVTLPLS